MFLGETHTYLLQKMQNLVQKLANIDVIDYFKPTRTGLLLTSNERRDAVVRKMPEKNKWFKSRRKKFPLQFVESKSVHIIHNHQESFGTSGRLLSS